MASVIDEIKIAYWNYNTYGVPLILGLIALVYLFFQEDIGSRKLRVYGVVIWILLMVPGISTLLLRVRPDSGDAWMVYGLTGCWLLAAYAISLYWAKQPSGKKQWAAVVITLFLLPFGMGLSFSGQQFALTTNLYKVSEETMEVADAMDEVNDPVLLAPPQLAEEIREYDSSISTYYGSEFMYSQAIPEQLMIEADTYGCNLVTVEQEYATEEATAYYGTQGFVPFYETESYVIYIELF